MNNEYEKEFEAPVAIDAPRFGHSDDFSHLFGTKEETEDYVLGVIFAGALLLSIFLAWFLLLVIFRCLGPKRVGFLSGGPFRRPVDEDRLHQQQLLNENQEDDGDEKVRKNALNKMDDYYEGNSWSKRPTRIRVFFLLSGTIFIIFSILSVTQGLVNLQTTVDSFNDNARVVDEISVEAEAILFNVKSIRATAIGVRDLLLEELKDGKFCLGDQTSFRQEGAAYEVIQQAEDAVPLLEQLEDFLGEDVDDMESVADKIQVSARAVEKETGNIDFNSWQGRIILIPFILVPAILVVATILAIFDVTSPRLSCFINWFVCPIFYLMVLFACICASLMIVGAGVNSDFCLPSGREEGGAPLTVDTSIIRLVEQEGYHDKTLEFKIAQFYVGQCRSGRSDPFQFMRDLQPALSGSKSKLSYIVRQMDDRAVLADLQEQCHRDFSSAVSLLRTMLDVVIIVHESLERTLDLASCENLVPIYTSVFYDGACTYSTEAVMWVLSGFLVTGFFGLLMITMRSAYKQTIYQTPQQAAEEAGEECGLVVLGDSADEEDDLPPLVRNDSTKTVEVDFGRDSSSGSHGEVEEAKSESQCNDPIFQAPEQVVEETGGEVGPVAPGDCVVQQVIVPEVDWDDEASFEI